MPHTINCKWDLAGATLMQTHSMMEVQYALLANNNTHVYAHKNTCLHKIIRNCTTTLCNWWAIITLHQRQEHLFSWSQISEFFFFFWCVHKGIMFSYYTAISCRQNSPHFVSLLGNHTANNWIVWLSPFHQQPSHNLTKTRPLDASHTNTNGTNWVQGRGKLVQIRD